MLCDMRHMLCDTRHRYKADLIVRKMRAQLPTMSVPNWITLLTGAPPEWTGVLGNLLVPETQYDSIMAAAARAGLGRSITGSPWFAEIVRSTLPLLDGDGTIPITCAARMLLHPSNN